MKSMVKFEVYIPESHFDTLREALNELGALKMGHYDQVIAITEVTGYWRPLEGSNPYEGEKNRITSAKELKLEFQCNEGITKKVIQTIRKVHPYETPVYRVFQMDNFLYE